MTKERNPFYTVIVVFLAAFMVPLAVANVMVLLSGLVNVWFRIGAACSIVSLLAALVYVNVGFTKSFSDAYKIFLWFYVVTLFFSLVGVAVAAESTLSIVLAALVYGLVLMLTMGKDLGKTRSTALCVLVVVLSAAQFVENGLLHPELQLGGETLDSLLLIRVASLLAMSVVLGVSTVAKYIDKAARGH